MTDSKTSHKYGFRVAYQETDGQRRVHHANYLNYFERGRVEMLRDLGFNYKTIEDEGRMLVVAEMNVKYFAPAEFDDWLELTTTVVEIRKVRMRHLYQIHRDDQLIVEADSVIACVDRTGKLARLPNLEAR
ncbi:acyl-CoA thioesterase [Rhodopirellula bahusiensis]|uniref:Thioesterase n=1 Tax=Rhodopirellula bahusiensis TaxID=2014065 RepID=A0A2G1W3C9_9BACT|nr:thioesterase family protein [Rhodopirellula bahusiensis]PHQ33548.1 thioesterase [Rhodopirellula bahusiensis]